MKEAKPKGLLFGVVDQQKGRKTLAEEDWKVPPERVKAPYAKRSNDELTPEYRRTREIRWEAGRTTSQA